MTLFSRRLFKLIAAVVVVGIGTQNAFGWSFLKTAADADNNWNNAANWGDSTNPTDPGFVPNVANTTGGAFGDRVAIGAPNQFPGSVSGGYATVDSAVPDIDSVLHVGLNGGEGTLEILPGGSLTNLSTMSVGEAACCGDTTGTILISGGTFNINTWARFSNRASAGFTATSNWIQTGGEAFIQFVNGWAGEDFNSSGTTSVNFDISGGYLHIPNGQGLTGPNANVDIVLSSTGRYVLADDWTADPTLGGIVRAAPGWELTSEFFPSNPEDPPEFSNSTVLSANFVGFSADFDVDNDVDGADFLSWQQDFGTTFDAADLANWESQFGGAGPLSALASAAVPEPSGIVLIVVGTLLSTTLCGRTRS